MTAHRYQSNPATTRHTWEDGGGLALIRSVLSQHAGSVCSTVLDSNEVPTWRCCVCVHHWVKATRTKMLEQLLTPPPHPPALPSHSCSPLLGSSHWINCANFFGQTKDRA